MSDGIRSEVYYPPGSTVTFRMPRADDERFAPEVAEQVVGQCPAVTQPDGTRHHGEVVAARFEGLELLLTLKVGDPETSAER